MQRTPAGLPSGIPGIGDVMEGAIQQAPHWERHSIPNELSPSVPLSLTLQVFLLGI
jgi:hypothetical protein